MFQMTRDEFQVWKSQFAASKEDRMGLRKRPFVFTQEGIAMLSGVLNSEQAIHVNIAIMRTFVKLREILSTHKELAQKLETLEKQYDAQFRVVFEAIRKLMDSPSEKKKSKIGFHTD